MDGRLEAGFVIDVHLVGAAVHAFPLPLDRLESRHLSFQLLLRKKKKKKNKRKRNSRVEQREASDAFLQARRRRNDAAR